VSIAEVLAAGSSVQCFDNSTRGLDSSTALDFVKALRQLTDVGKKTTLATLYQAGENIYKYFDKVLLIDQGHEVFFGRGDEAKAYFEDLGFVPMQGETIAEFLTNVTDAGQRKTRPGSKADTISSPQQLAAAFRESATFTRLQSEMSQYEMQLAAQESPIPSSSYNLSYSLQVFECLRRDFQLVKGQRRVYYTKWVTTLVLCFTVGSLYHDLTATAQGAFTRGGILFFALILNAWLQFPELFDAHTNRPVLERQGQSSSEDNSSKLVPSMLTLRSGPQSLSAVCGCLCSSLDGLATYRLSTWTVHLAFLLPGQTSSRCRKILLLLLDAVPFNRQLQ